MENIMALIEDARKDRDNLAQFDGLTQKINSLESQTLVFMAEASALHGAVDAADQAKVIALRDQLITKLQAALTV